MSDELEYVGFAEMLKAILTQGRKVSDFETRVALVRDKNCDRPPLMENQVIDAESM